MTFDPVKRPKHYNDQWLETIDKTRALLSPEEWRGACKYQLIKYTERAGKKVYAGLTQKESRQRDEEKAKWFYSWLQGVDPRGEY